MMLREAGLESWCMGEVDPDEDTLCAAGELDTRSVIAWGLDEDYEESRRWFTPGRITALAVVTSALLVSGTGWVAWQHLKPEPEPVAQSRSWMPPPSWEPSSTIVAAPPVTSTVTVAPEVTHEATPVMEKTPAATTTTQTFTPEYLAPFDRQFLRTLTADGWNITHPDVDVEWGHGVCKSLQDGMTPEEINQRIMDEFGIGLTQALDFSSTAMIVYPKCRAR